jgi:hypothetical protein
MDKLGGKYFSVTLCLYLGGGEGLKVNDEHRVSVFEELASKHHCNYTYSNFREKSG